MTKHNHADILTAYLSRLTTNDLISILHASNACGQAQLNGNDGQQRLADIKFSNTVSDVMCSMTEHDINNLTYVVNTNTDCDCINIDL